jgi:hypothetical protein
MMLSLRGQIFIKLGLFLDSQEVSGLTLPTFVADPKWSQDLNIAGRDVRTITVIELAYQGIENWSLRQIAHGRNTKIEFCRSFRESVVVAAILQAMRTAQRDPPIGVKFDWDSAIAELCKNTDTPWQNGDSAENRQARRKCYSKLGEHMVAQFIKGMPKPIPDEAQAKILELEQQVAALKAKQTLTSPVIESLHANTKDAKRQKLIQALNPKDRTPILSKSAPSSSTKSSMDKWIKELRCNPTQATLAKSLIQDAEQFTEPHPDMQIETWAVQWGFPPRGIAKWSNEALIKLMLWCHASLS